MIVDNTEAAWSDRSRWRLGDTPTLEIGAGIAGDSALQFAYILGVHRMAGGGIGVLDSWAPAVVFLDASGRLTGRVGRTGTGPGEFTSRSVRSSFACGTDSVYVVLGQNVAVYVPPAEYVRTFKLAQPSNVLTCSEAGIIAETTYGGWRTSPGTFTDSALIIAHTMDGLHWSVIDTLPRQISNWSSGPEGAGYSLAPFSPTLSVATNEGVIATGFSDRFEVAVRDEFGVVKRIIRVAGLERSVSERDVEAFLTYVFNPWRGNEDERRELEQHLAATAGKPFPAFAELRFDAAGNLWARAFDELDALAFYDYSRFVPGITRPEVAHPRRWVVMDRDGRYVGTIEIPHNFTVHEIGSDHVLGVWRDELDIQFVREYPLIKPST